MPSITLPCNVYMFNTKIKKNKQTVGFTERLVNAGCKQIVTSQTIHVEWCAHVRVPPDDTRNDGIVIRGYDFYVFYCVRPVEHAKPGARRVSL